jgi:hypothetical protein
VLVRLEKLVVERERALEDHEAAVVGAVVVQVHDALDAVLEAAVGGLVDVRPGGDAVGGLFFGGEGEGDVDAVCG